MRTCIECRICSFFFQLTDTPLWSYCAASTIGLLPTTVLNCYMGSTLRTMSDVLTDQSNQTTGYLILSVQVSSLKKKKYIYVLLPAKNLSCSISFVPIALRSDMHCKACLCATMCSIVSESSQFFQTNGLDSG